MIRRPEDCRIHTGLRAGTGYPVVSIRIGEAKKDSSVKLALHQMPARIAERDPGSEVSNWKEDDSVASHLCNVKMCLTCAVRESRKYNNHRTTCQSIILVNFKLVVICTHDPKCKSPGSKAYPPPK